MDRERVVFAEFAINWKTGEAHPSHTYLDEGLDKVDTEEFKASWGPADFTGGFLVSNIGHTFDSWHGDINTTWVCTVNLTSEVEYQPSSCGTMRRPAAGYGTGGAEIRV